MQIKIGTRGSKLALWQANWVKDSLLSKHKNIKNLEIEIVIIKTKGDKILDTPLAKIGGKGLFVKEIEEALLRNQIDIAVHSMKDMPTQVLEGLCISAIPEREDYRDVLISKDNLKFHELPIGAVIGTSSLRRAAQIKHLRPDLKIKDLRGNLDTRIKKLEDNLFDAIIVACAGVKRLGLNNKIAEYLDENIILPAVSQGALCIESRQNDIYINKLVLALDNKETRLAILAERAFLNKLEGGCQVPIAALGKILDNLDNIDNDNFVLNGLVADIDGKLIIKDKILGKKENAEQLGIELANKLIDIGAKSILDNLKKQIQ